MNFLKEWAIALLILMCVISLFLGYFWRMYHEIKNWDKWRAQIIKEFLVEIEEEQNIQFRIDRWEFVKRADGSVVMKRR